MNFPKNTPKVTSALPKSVLCRFKMNSVEKTATKGNIRSHEGELPWSSPRCDCKKPMRRPAAKHHKGFAMNLKLWEATLQQIADEFSLAPKEAAQQRILAAWRAKLEKEPTSLLPYQIDQIVREIRTRFAVASR